VARWPYRFAHSHRRRRYGLDTLQAAVRELSVFSWVDFREEEFGVTKDSCEGLFSLNLNLAFNSLSSWQYHFGIIRRRQFTDFLVRH
jgi:hypothetical protein